MSHCHSSHTKFEDSWEKTLEVHNLALEIKFSQRNLD